MIKDKHIIDIFKATDQIEKMVYLDNNSILTVWNIAWGYDIESESAHITTNISPEIPNADVDFFYTNQIQKIENLINGEILYNKKKSEL
ncbi:MAG: hypothetical protein J0G96_07415 [Flavobacteriia bacterium]|mgnify:CR=1 FL=1|nr:hypothetical protein [Flavobacteriia bacterium]OJX36950.1 MAG: hypothetical protein BGO87_14320 [Flavobacteriia bacterium 40-80]